MEKVWELETEREDGRREKRTRKCGEGMKSASDRKTYSVVTALRAMFLSKLMG